MRKIQIAQRSPEWLKLRREKIGASDAPVILGVSPYSTPAKLWEQKVLGKEVHVNSGMQRGTDMEEAARNQYEIDTGFLVMPCVVIHSKHDWMMASLDGMDMEEKNAVEIKCPCKNDHELAKKGLIPEKYFPQLQHQMEVTELDKIHYYSYDGLEGVILILRRDDSYISEMLKKEEEFLRCMKELIPPNLTAKDLIKRDDVDWIRAAEEYKNLSIQQEEIERKMKEARDSLINLAGDHSCEGEGVRITKLISKGRIDYASIPELKVINLDSYRKEPVESWRVAKI